jgi:hypothetical protein
MFGQYRKRRTPVLDTVRNTDKSTGKQSIRYLHLRKKFTWTAPFRNHGQTESRIQER